MGSFLALDRPRGLDGVALEDAQAKSGCLLGPNSATHGDRDVAEQRANPHGMRSERCTLGDGQDHDAGSTAATACLIVSIGVSWPR